MSPKKTQRAADCTKDTARKRLDMARKFYEVAEVVETEADVLPTAISVAGSLAVLAGIAASDAACCAALGRHSRGQGHKAAVDMLRQVAGGDAAASRLDAMLDKKDSAHYGAMALSRTELKTIMRSGKALIDFAAGVLSRS